VGHAGISRAYLTFRFSEHERQEDWLQGIGRGLPFTWRSPQEILFDNAKTIMSERDAYGEGPSIAGTLTNLLTQQAQDYGFIAPARLPASELALKAKVERSMANFEGQLYYALAATLHQALACDRRTWATPMRI